MKFIRLILISLIIGPVLLSARVEAQMNPTCTDIGVASRAVSYMRSYLMAQVGSVRSLLNQILAAGSKQGKIRAYVARKNRALDQALLNAQAALDNLPVHVPYCTDPACYNVSLQEEINQFIFAAGAIQELHSAIGARFAVLLGTTKEAIDEIAARNFMVLMDATDAYPRMTMVCP